MKNLKIVPPTEERLTPFGEFLGALALSTTRTTSDVGAVQWTDFPYEEIVAHGLIGIIQFAAERLQKKATTENAVLEDIGPRVNVLLNKGLLLLYKNGEAAAKDFREHVETEMKKLAKETRGTFNPADLWQRPATSFFEKLLGACYDQALKFDRLAQKYYEIHERHIKNFLLLEGSNPLEYSLCSRTWRLETVSQKNDVDSIKIKKEIAILKKLQDEITLAKVLEEFRPAIDDYAHVRFSDQVMRNIETSWMRSQLLLAVLGVNTRGYLEGLQELRRGLRRLQEVENVEAINRFNARMTARDVTNRTLEHPLIKQRLEAHLKILRDLDIEGENGLGFLVVYAERDHKRIPRTDLLFWACNKPMVSPFTPTLAQVVRDLSWEALDLDELRSIMSAGRLSLSQILDNVSRMEPKAREDFVRYVLTDPSYQQKARERVVERDLLKHTPKLMPLFSEVITPEQWFKELHRLLEKDDHKNEVETILSEILKINSSKLKPLLQDPEFRHDVLQLLLTVKHPSSLKEKMGKELWQRFYLALVIVEREDEYRSPSKRLIVWENLTNSSDGIGLQDNLQASRQELAKLLKKYPEDEIFRWYHEAEPNLPKLLARYQAQRAAYYAKHLSPPRAIRRKEHP